MTSLYARLSLFFLIVLLLMGFFILWLADRSARQYFLEFNQELNSPIAMYMAQNANLLTDGTPNADALARLSEHVMMVNPSVEVYLLDADGRVVGHSQSVTPALQQVRLEPIKQFLDGRQSYPLLGDNPNDPRQTRTFSVHPLEEGNRVVGYVYAVLTGERHLSVLQAVSSSYTLKAIWITTISVLAVALLAGVVVFFMLTRRLRQLTGRVQHLQADALAQHGRSAAVDRRDELDELAHAYESMAQRLMEQYQALEHSDSVRRELFANISHDLRTPLTTMQGYLETLQLKRGSLSEEQQQACIDVALRQSIRLNELIGELFELSRLSSGEFELCLERFSLVELAHDCIQDFQIRSIECEVDLRVEADTQSNLDVVADISLIQRIFENLLDNALRYTPPNGSVVISIQRVDEYNICATVSDTGVGMASDVAARVFDRHYRDGDSADALAKQHAGLGLAIVRSILDLHNSEIRVRSRRHLGTSFQFDLQAASAQSAGLPDQQYADAV
jgi:signal transduction histidine kinase